VLFNRLNNTNKHSFVCVYFHSAPEEVRVTLAFIEKAL